MKKVLLVLLVMALFLGITFATDFNFKGSFRTRTIDYKNPVEGFNEFGYDTVSVIDSRFRLYTNAVFSENIKAVLGFEIGDFKWGDEGHNHDFKNVETKRAMFVFIPDFLRNITFTVGLQGYTDQFQASVFDEDIAGLLIEPKLESFNIKAGLFNYTDDDVMDENSHTFALIDISKQLNNLNIKSSLYYDDIRNERVTMYLGGGADYTLDQIVIGGHLLYMTRSYETDGVEDITGYFAYTYGEYSMDKFGLRVNFGYTPSDDNTYFEGVEPYAESYGLEYAYQGPVNDSNGLIEDYGTMGQMVLSAKAEYDFLYATFGIINTTNSGIDDKRFGNEFDLGIKKEITEGLTFKAVYAYFMPGNFSGPDTDNAHEFSTQLKYKF
ncbi:MAG: hypothetical protein FXF47_07215 [Candidatus Mcinerneyibacterium aminivorans]|uniref:Alginate export domain-containing protein n=1 Tax=Candidatus Mcinerneyibacterium aminivorans TaxID=2703815 RepID=A0A5D0MJT0_9BACT|nr:MAG: hypothetical protein FXF47_07215 [Candidatus Mcinerneyibacterium aminivorans]